jgi:hypothetical protein
MATFQQVISMLIPNGGYVANGETYEGIEFLEATPITKEQFETGFAQYDAWKTEQAAAKAHERAALLERLGITEEEARLLLGGN